MNTFHAEQVDTDNNNERSNAIRRGGAMVVVGMMAVGAVVGVVKGLHEAYDAVHFEPSVSQIHDNLVDTNRHQ